MDEKPKLFNIKNFIKQENGRLTSLTMPRDLSLGGTRPKKVYSPNLNVVRNKNKNLVNIQKAQKAEKSKRSSLANDVNRNQNSGRFVQSHSVFSEGTGDLRRPNSYSKHTTVRDHESGPIIDKPKITTNWNVDSKEEAGVVNDLLNCDQSSSDEENDYMPIVLPLRDNKNGFFNNFKVKKPNDIKIKREECANGCAKMLLEDHGNVVSSLHNPKLFDEDNISLSLVKFPDSIPGKGFDDDNNRIDYSLKQMIEGKIGRILVRKSGRLEMEIGKTKYTLDTIEAAQCCEEVMCESSDEEQKPQMATIGNINEKFVLAPQWMGLLPKKDDE